MSSQRAALLEAAADVVRPIARLTPAAFAEAYRYLAPGKSPIPGPWRNANALYLVDVMNAIEEAIRTGKRGVVLMKASQVGGSEALAVIVVQWLLTYYPGPILYLTAIETNAEEFARDRWDGPDGAIATCEPLRKKHLEGKRHGEKLTVKRFTDSKLVFAGSQSVNHVISNPYRFVIVDEVDSINEFKDGNPLLIAEHRTRAWAEGGATLIIAFAHPSTPERGAAKLYYELSDQRRGHVECPHCKTWVAPTWDDMKVLPVEGESLAAAARIPERYHFVAACCGTTWSEADRRKAIRRVDQRSTLPAGSAERDWIGLHIWRFFNESLGAIGELAREWILGLDDDSSARVFVNKTLAEPWRTEELSTGIEIWERLATPEGEPGAYKLGTVPNEARWLTAGQDSNARDLHWAVFAWGLVASEGGHPILCGWLVDYGVEAGPARFDETRRTLHAEDLEVLDQALYSKLWPTVTGDRQLFVGQCFHDSGWQQVGVYDYCRAQPGRAIPSKGAALDDRARDPAITWKRSVKTKIGEEEVSYPELARADLNTYLLKLDFTGLAGKRFLDKDKVPRARLALPHDVSSEFLAHLASEKLVLEDGRRRWVKTSHENHWWDCAILAYAAALNTAPVSPSSAKVTAPSVPSRPLRERRFGGGRSNWLRRRSR